MGNGVGRPPFEMDTEAMINMLEDGVPKSEIAGELGCSINTLNKKINDLRQKEGILLNWRAIKSLKLTELQAAILDRITPEKIEEASLKDLVLSYKVLSESETEIENPVKGKITGLVAYLIELEKRNYVIGSETSIIDVTPKLTNGNDEDEVFQF
jgi:hypothetical protein